ncbi:MAG: hypothetical protein FWH31_02405 [Streptococcaceae bacterium]|nr:hypothetical protein [Streptococcaceae bacterium]
MKKIKHKGIIGIIIILLIGGIIVVSQMNSPFDVFLSKDYTKPTKAEQIAYLKKHEQEMTDFVKSQNAKVKSVQWQWDTVDVGQIGNGTPQGGGEILTINGKFNEIKDSSFYLQFDLVKNQSIVFKSMSLPSALYIGGKIYE